jgi:hypothetical protein
MTSAASARPGKVFGSLWMRAPLWRASLIMALLSTTTALLYPPMMRNAKPPAPALPEQVAYQPPAEPVAPRPVVAPPTVATAAPAVPKQPGNSSARQARVDVPRPQTASAAPANAQISMSVPGSPVSKDPSGLDTALMGRTYNRSIAVDGFDVPLPPGQWAMLANSSVHVRNASGMFYFLGRIEHKRLVGGLRVLALKTPDKPGDGFPAIRGCVAGNPGLNYVFVDSITGQIVLPALKVWIAPRQATWRPRESPTRKILSLYDFHDRKNGAISKQPICSILNWMDCHQRLRCLSVTPTGMSRI